MKWQALVEAAQRYEREEGARYSVRYRQYRDARDEHSWWSEGGPTEVEARALLDFLMTWNSRIQYKSQPDVVVRHFAAAGRVSAAALSAIQNSALEEVTLDLSTREAIKKAYDAFSCFRTQDER